MSAHPRGHTPSTSRTRRRVPAPQRAVRARRAGRAAWPRSPTAGARSCVARAAREGAGRARSRAAPRGRPGRSRSPPPGVAIRTPSSPLRRSPTSQPRRTRSPSSAAIARASASLPPARREERSGVSASSARTSALASQAAETRSSPTVYVPSRRRVSASRASGASGVRRSASAAEMVAAPAPSAVTVAPSVALGVEQQPRIRLPARAHLARGERESVLGRARARSSAARRSRWSYPASTNSPAALDARAVGHDVRPDASAHARRGPRRPSRRRRQRARSTAQARPAKPAPTTATRMALRRGAQQAVAHEQLGDLHGVRRRALAQVVGDDPQRERVRIAEVAADAADEHVVLARRRRCAVG